jgi:cell division protease FtsH
VAVREMVEAQFQRARAILATNRQLLDESAGRLLAQETLAGPELEAMLGRVGKEPGPRIAAASA